MEIGEEILFWGKVFLGGGKQGGRENILVITNASEGEPDDAGNVVSILVNGQLRNVILRINLFKVDKIENT